MATSNTPLKACSGAEFVKLVADNDNMIKGLSLRCLGVVETSTKSVPNEKCVLNMTIVTFDKIRIGVSSWDARIVGAASDAIAESPPNLQVRPLNCSACWCCFSRPKLVLVRTYQWTYQ